LNGSFEGNFISPLTTALMPASTSPSLSTEDPGLEIPVKVIVEMKHSTRGREILARYQTLIRDNYQEPTDGKFDDCKSEIFKLLAAEDSSDSESVELEDNWWTKSNKKLLNMKLRHPGIAIIKQQLEFHYFIDIIYSIKFRDFNLRVS